MQGNQKKSPPPLGDEFWKYLLADPLTCNDITEKFHEYVHEIP